MFAILTKACVSAAVCSVVFGPVDWSKPHSGDLIWVAGVQVIIGNGLDGAAPDDPDLIASGKVIKKIIGDKQILCAGIAGGHNTYRAKCYFYGKRGQVLEVSEEMHKRGFSAD
jgi:hypothetical protein